ncbi:unnamed protein product [Lota lota]
MSKATDACGCSPTPHTSAPTASPDQSGPIWEKVALVSTFPSHEGALCVGPPASHTSGTCGSTRGRVGGEDHDVVKRGYMGKAERYHRRYFVLRAGSPTRPARLEWYGTEESFKATEKSSAAAGKEALFGCGKRRVIYLRCCLGVSKVSSTSKGHTVVLYAKDYTLVMVAEDTGQQEEWYWTVKRLIEEEKRYEEKTEDRGEGEDEGGERLDEEDDGYCTLSSGVFTEVWLVTVQPRGLGRTKSLAGEMRLCLSADSLVLVRGWGGWLRLPAVTLPLLSVRCYGHRDGMFFLELGRSAPHGPGEVWMEVKDQVDRSLALQVHEAVRDAVRALRVLPDFRLSPVAADNHQNGPQRPPCDQRTRTRSRDKVGREVPHALPTAAETVQAELAAGAGACPCGARSPGGSGTGSSPGLRSHLSSANQTSGYMEMAVEAVSMATVTGGTYMAMSPQGTHHTPHGEDYVAMASPQPLLPWPDLWTCMSPVQINRFSSDDHQSYPLTFGTGRPDWSFPVFRQREPPDPIQLELLNSSRHVSQGEEEPTCCPASRPVRADFGRSALRRYVMSSCLPSCLRHDEDQ